MADRSANETAKDISLAGVGGRDPPGVAEDEDTGSNVVTEDSDRHIIVFISSILFLCQGFDLSDDRSKYFSFIDRLFALQDSYRSLDSHSGIDALTRHLTVGSVGALHILHEHVVPDLKVLTAGTTGATIRSARLSSGVDEHLTVGAARTGFTGGSPPVIFPGKKVDSIIGNTEITPRLGRFFIPRNVSVTGEDRYREFIGFKTQYGRQKLVAVGDCFFFKVIAQRPVAEHLKER